MSRMCSVPCDIFRTGPRRHDAAIAAARNLIRLDAVESQDSLRFCAACITLESPLKPLPTFYQSQLVLGLLVGFALIALPATIVEAPEPSFTAETLLRRCSGVGASVMGGTAIWSLLGAAARGRLGASTFVQLNATLGVVNVAVRPCPCIWGNLPSCRSRIVASSYLHVTMSNSLIVPRGM